MITGPPQPDIAYETGIQRLLKACSANEEEKMHEGTEKITEIQSQSSGEKTNIITICRENPVE